MNIGLKKILGIFLPYLKVQTQVLQGCYGNLRDSRAFALFSLPCGLHSQVTSRSIVAAAAQDIVSVSRKKAREEERQALSI